MLAKNKTKAAEMVQSMRDRDIQKTYLARVKGKFPYDEYTCTEPIETVSHKVGVNVVSANGKPCITKFTFVKFNGTTSLVKCEPKTGRTHQIRVHLQWLGFPIANDPVYCNEAWKDYLFNNENVEQVVNNVTDIVFAAEATVDDDIGCIECRNNRKDPIPEQLFIWLHSLKYESDNWAYETKLPSWAHDGFDGDKDIQKRFWDHGGRWDGEAPGTIVSFNDT
jgi:tRNA pseudouridine synthase 9